MRFLIFILLCLPLISHASILIQYGLNYSSEKDVSENGDFEESRTFHKVLIGASVNQRKTFFFGWNISSWSSSLSQGTNPEDTYSMLEMGPRLLWFFDENYNWYATAEWNVYAKGDREKSSDDSEVSGSSIGMGIGYRFRISRFVGLGAGIHYQSLDIKEEKIGSTVNNVSNKITNIMPMLELSILTK